MHTPAEKAAFIAAQTEMMIAERMVMLAENAKRESEGSAPYHGPEQWEAFRRRWDGVLGWNVLISYLND